MSSEIIDNNETIEINETPQLLTPLVDNIEAPQPEIPGPTSPITTFSSSQEYTEVSQTTETTSTAEVNEPTSQETISSQSKTQIIFSLKNIFKKKFFSEKPFSKKPEYRKKLRIRRRRAFFRTLKKQQMKTKPQFNPFECPCFVKVDNIPDTWDQFKLEVRVILIFSLFRVF